MMLLKESQLRKLICAELYSRQNKRALIVIGDRQIYAEVADTQSSRDFGLMFRKSLDENSGMLFVFDDDDTRGFWMKNTNIPLSIAFLDNSGYILNIEKMMPHSLCSTYSNGPARYALEMNQGWFDKNKISEGDLVSINKII